MTPEPSSPDVPTPPIETVVLRHNRIDLALHRLRDGEGRPLLALHGLGEHTPATAPDYLAAWPGPIWGLDFTGHGASTVSIGGGYTCELLMADADQALAHLGPVSIFGRGLGAYVGLLLAGARPSEVRGVILFDGPGLGGGGVRPGTVSIIHVDPAESGPPDPFALKELSRDVRPTDYAVGFARQAVEKSGFDAPLVVAAYARPEWLAAVASEFGVEQLPLDAALRRLATLA